MWIYDFYRNAGNMIWIHTVILYPILRYPLKKAYLVLHTATISSQHHPEKDTNPPPRVLNSTA
jgi:hypothetical protein